jgi:hypothetical protein
MKTPGCRKPVDTWYGQFPSIRVVSSVNESGLSRILLGVWLLINGMILGQNQTDPVLPPLGHNLGDGVRERIPILDAFIGRTAATMGSLANFLAGSSGTSPYLRRTMVVVPPSRSAVDPCHRYLKPRRAEIENRSPTPSPAGLAWRWGTRSLTQDE